MIDRTSSSDQQSLHEAELIAQWKREEQEPFAGWDFSYLEGRCIEEELPWSYEKMVRNLMANSRSILDIGTGGAEKLLEFKDIFPPSVTVTEGYPPNLRLAKDRLEPLGVTVIEANDSLESLFPFEDEAFDLIINRHSAFNIAEIERMLTPGGIFLTQQVDGRNLNDLLAAFESRPLWPYFTLDFVLERVDQTNLIVDLAQEWTGTSTFTDVGAIVYYLKAVPWSVQDFSVERHLIYLQNLQRRLDREGSLVFTQKRLLLKVRKPKS